MRETRLSLSQIIVIGAIGVLLSALLAPLFLLDSVAAARDTANLHRISVAMAQYINDQDGMMPLFIERRPNGTCLPNAPQICGKIHAWHFGLHKYLGDWKVFSAPGEKLSENPEYVAYSTSYGYNYAYLSTLCVKSDIWSQERLRCPRQDYGNPQSSSFFVSINVSEIQNPAQAIMLTSSNGRKKIRPSNLNSIVSSPLPDTYSNRYEYGSISYSGWADNCPTVFTVPFTTEPNSYEGFEARHSGKGLVAMVDGSIQLMTPTEAARGTIFYPSIPCNWPYDKVLKPRDDMFTITDYHNFLWDPVKL